MLRTITCRLAACAVAICSTPALAKYYTFTDLGVLSGGSSRAVAINNLGQIAGNAAVLDPVLGNGEHAFVYGKGGMTDLGTLGGTYSQASAINDRGEVVGTADNPDGDSPTFIYSGGTMKRIEAISRLSPYSTGRGINNSGQVVGDIWHYGSGAFLYADGAVTDLGNFGGPWVSSAYASGINSLGQIVGQAPQGTESYAFLYDHGTLTKIGPNGSFATAINDAGQIVGAYGPYGGGWLLSDGVVTSFGGGVPRDINADGVVIGTELRGSRANGAFIYDEGKYEKLTDLMVEQNSGWNLLEANGINDVGQIVGTAQYKGGARHAYLLTPTDLTPVPEPITLVLMAVGLPAVLAASRRRRGGADFRVRCLDSCTVSPDMVEGKRRGLNGSALG